jgi:two-component system OmpR family sensor kinase
MFNSLRARLLLSYTVIIGLTLCIVGAALILLLLNSPIPAAQVYLRLANIARDNTSALRAEPGQIDEHLAEVAAANDIRTLRVGPEGAVLFDSAGQLESGQTVNLRAAPSDDARFQRGTYRGPNGRLWLYVGYGPLAAHRETGLIVLATPRLTFLNSLGGDLLRLLLQAGLIGLVLSVLFAVLISASVARPLRRTVAATRAVASGDYGQQVPEDGPREVRDLAHAFNAMSRQVQRAQQTQRDFLANVSHELKTPLTSIQGYSQAILDGAASEPARAAQVIHDEAGRMRRMVEDLLDLARIESGQAKMRREHVNLGDLLKAVLDRFVIQAGEQGVRLVHEIGEMPHLTGDNDRLMQVFANLIDNALAHTPAGGQITVRAQQVDSGVRVTVSDTGKGLPAEDLGRVFERFYQVDKSRARSGRKGTGLGLTISKEIVEIHGGTIRAESPQGQGATFHVWLPLPRSSDETVVSSPRGS